MSDKLADRQEYLSRGPNNPIRHNPLSVPIIFSMFHFIKLCNDIRTLVLLLIIIINYNSFLNKNFTTFI